MKHASLMDGGGYVGVEPDAHVTQGRPPAPGRARRRQPRGRTPAAAAPGRGPKRVGISQRVEQDLRLESLLKRSVGQRERGLPREFAADSGS